MTNSAFKLIVLSSLFLLACTAAAIAMPFDDSLPPDRDNVVQRKQGDMAVYWYGRSAVHYGRLGSLGNRAYQGGGLHGGK